MVRARAPYIEWAKLRPSAAIDLAGSNVLACPIEEIGGAREALDLSGDNSDGYPPLLDAIAVTHGVPADCVATGPGCAGANFLVLAALIDPGDDVLVESPGYDPLTAAARMLGASVRSFERRFEEGYGLDPARIAAALTPRTRAVVVTNPHNPSGALLPPPALDELATLLERRGIVGLVDEVYLDATPGARIPSAVARSPAFVSTSSLTKAYGLSTLRCGWAIGLPELAARIRRARDVVDGSGSIVAERLAAAAFGSLENLRTRARGILEPNRGLFERFLASRPELECVAPAAPIAFPRFRDRRNAGPFVQRLFAKYRVAVVPGSFFSAPDQFRISLGGATAALREGLEAVGRALDHPA